MNILLVWNGAELEKSHKNNEPDIEKDVGVTRKMKQLQDKIKSAPADNSTSSVINLSKLRYEKNQHPTNIGFVAGFIPKKICVYWDTKNRNKDVIRILSLQIHLNKQRKKARNDTKHL